MQHVMTCRYSPATSSVPTWLDNLRCTSTDTSLLTCRHNGAGNEDCVHSEDVALTCSDSSLDGYGKSYMSTMDTFLLKGTLSQLPLNHHTIYCPIFKSLYYTLVRGCGFNLISIAFVLLMYFVIVCIRRQVIFNYYEYTTLECLIACKEIHVQVASDPRLP